jgi:glycerol-3-phosphate dehydrogenase
MNRADHLHRLATETFDLCIIGGGASGAGCALDATLRGLKVALVEKTDFAAETSSRSTKLVHGGVRYLEQAFKNLDFAQLRQVRHGLEERRIVLQNAPHLACPLGLVTPVFSWWEGLYFSIGLALYDWFAGRRSNVPSSRWLSKRTALALLPSLSPRIHSAVRYYDGQLDDARYCLALAQSAAEAGTALANHLEVLDFQKDNNGKINAATARDALSGTQIAIRAKAFLNCTGPYADHLRRLANPALPARIRPSKGVHLVLPAQVMPSYHAMLIPKTRDGRMVFALPFEGSLLLGTTDEPYSALAQEPILEASEVDFLLETLQPFVSQKIEKEQVKAGFGGLRPLLNPTPDPSPEGRGGRGASRAADASAFASPLPSGEGSGPTKSLLRDHEVERDPDSGLLSLLGGKWTTYRLMARDAVDAACRTLGIRAECRTENHALAGAEGFEPDFWKKLHAAHGFDEDVCQHLAAKYGTRAAQVAALTAETPELRGRILPQFPFLKAEIVYAVRAEMALTLRDFLARRIRLEFTDWQAARAAAPAVAHWMGKELAWSEVEKTTFLAEYDALLTHFIQKSKPL